MDNWTPRPDMSISRFSDHVRLWYIRGNCLEHDQTETDADENNNQNEKKNDEHDFEVELTFTDEQWDKVKKFLQWCYEGSFTDEEAWDQDDFWIGLHVSGILRRALQTYRILERDERDGDDIIPQETDSYLMIVESCYQRPAQTKPVVPRASAEVSQALDHGIENLN